MPGDPVVTVEEGEEEGSGDEEEAHQVWHEQQGAESFKELSFSEGTSESSEEDADDDEWAGEPAPVTLDQIDDCENVFVDGSIDADVSGKMAVISLLHQVYWVHEVEIEPEAAKRDGSGRFQYLVACRCHQARPIIPALMMMSGQTLLLHNYGMQAADARALAAGLAENVTITDVHLGENTLGEGCVDLAKALVRNKSVKKLLMKGVSAGWQGGGALGSMLVANKTLTHLDVRANRIGDRACAEILGALKHNTGLTHLDMADNLVGARSIEALSEALLENVSLTYLDLSWNHIRAQDLKLLCPALAENSFIKAVSLAWNGIGHARESPQKGGGGGGHREVGGGAALVELIRATTSITELDISNCRLGSTICLELASAIQSNKTLRHMQLDGNPMGTDAAEVLKQLNTRMLQGSLLKFSMDNCQFDPLKRVLDFDVGNPSGYYRLDLADPKDREICAALIKDAKTRKRDFLRNEKLNNLRFTLVTSGEKEWKMPSDGIFECDCIVTEPPEPGTQPMDPDDFRFLSKVMEMSKSDTGRMNLLKQACRAHYLDITMALSVLFKFGLDSSRESALVLMFAHIIDRASLFVLHAALSERSKYNLHKRIGPLHIMNRIDPVGAYSFDLTKGDDVKALRILLEMLRSDATARLRNVKYCPNVWETPQIITPDSPVWGTVFPSGAIGRTQSVPHCGVLELQYECMRVAAVVLKDAISKLVSGGGKEVQKEQVVKGKTKAGKVPTWTKAEWGKGKTSTVRATDSEGGQGGDEPRADKNLADPLAPPGLAVSENKFNASFSMDMSQESFDDDDD